MLMSLMMASRNQAVAESSSVIPGLNSAAGNGSTPFLTALAQLADHGRLPEHLLTKLPAHGLAQLLERSASLEEEVELSEGDATLIADLSEEQWSMLLSELLQLLTSAQQREQNPKTGKLIEQFERLFTSSSADGRLHADTTAKEKALSDFISWVGQLSEQEQQRVVKQVALLLGSLQVDRELTTPVVPMRSNEMSNQDSHKRNASRPSDLPATIDSPKENATARTHPSIGSDPVFTALEKSVGVVDMPKVPVAPHGGEQAVRSGELVEMTTQRMDGVQHMPASSVANTSAQATVTRPVMWLSHQFADTLQQYIVRHLQINPNGVSQARITLYPENLGQIDVRISSHNGMLTAHLVADTWLARELLDGQLDQLRQTLQNQGLQVNKLEVSVGQQQGMLSRHFHHSQEPEWTGSFKQEQSGSNGHHVDSYTDSETSRVESWRNPHASINYTV